MALLHGRGGAEQVAGLLSMHSRTLSRRRRASGTSFQSLADECRFEIARQLLGLSNMSVARIAAALDYADASAFTRAFRRWSGATPGQFRALQNHAAHTGRSPGAVVPTDKFLD